MDFIQAVKDAAKSLNLLDKTGRLVRLDSLSVTEMIVALEDSTKLSIPTSALRPEAFASIESLASLLNELSERAQKRNTGR